MMNEHRKSDRPIVPKKLPNEDGTSAVSSAEEAEGRGRTKENPQQQNRSRAQTRQDLHNALERVRAAAARDKELQFTTLWHHVYNTDRLREAYFSLKRQAAP